MTSETNESIKFKITSEIEISQRDFQILFPQFQRSENTATRQFEKLTEISNAGTVPRLAFTIRETATILGIAQGSVRKLVRRGLLRSSSVLRNLIIPKSEIERFLRETTEADR